jgi:predicted CoA-substrate-specific enzyme activase
MLVGLDVGSTTVKGVLMDSGGERILWSDYRRHEARQGERVFEFLQAIEALPIFQKDKMRIFVTGSGGRPLAKHIGVQYVQEVNAVSLAVEKLHPRAGSLVELGGQDAKVVIWLEDVGSVIRRKFASMNDKCAGGTGAVIDKMCAKLGLSLDELAGLDYDPSKIHPVAGKCGVFAETDIIGLQKQGVHESELMTSLFDAIVQQNLSVLTRGNTLRPAVLLLGGPNTFIPALQKAWKHNISQLWRERSTPLPESVEPDQLVFVPENALYYAAIGAALYGKNSGVQTESYCGADEFKKKLQLESVNLKTYSADHPLVESEKELEEFKKSLARKTLLFPSFRAGQQINAYVGIDGGSTSTKAVLLDGDGTLLAGAYQLSRGNPLEDAKDVLRSLRVQVESQGAQIRVCGVGITGYAKEMLTECIGADVALAETIAHTNAALHFFKDVDVIVDVGGQDIKVIVLRNGRIKDFRLNTQCSAGNGYFLQATAERFGYDMSTYADAAFSARSAPSFSYGCAVFLESDIVNFQQSGWTPSEILAGLARVLPKNIWLYVMQEPNLSRLGRIFVLQGGTHRNLAAVKAQVDFIKAKVPDAKIHVHPFCGESGAIGVALEAMRAVKSDTRDSANQVAPPKFIGLRGIENLKVTTRRDESTRCHRCRNQCIRTFVVAGVPNQTEQRKLIIASCEKGSAEHPKDLKLNRTRLAQTKRKYPNFAEINSRLAFESKAHDQMSSAAHTAAQRISLESNELSKKDQIVVDVRKKGRGGIMNLLTLGLKPTVEGVGSYRDRVRIGIPRVLNLYSVAPFFIAYLESVGVKTSNIRFSERTNAKMWKEGSRRGSIDPCFPSKSALAHVHNLVFRKRDCDRVDVILFPILSNLRTQMCRTVASCACPAAASTPEVCKALFTKEIDLFSDNGIEFHDPVFHMAEPKLLEIELYRFFRGLLGVTKKENQIAIERGYRALDEFIMSQQREAGIVLRQLERENRVGVVALGRPYHDDPGLNHEILESVQKLGYPVFTVQSLPQDDEVLTNLFGEEIRRGVISSGLEIGDVWKNSFSENSNMKIWGAKYVARHPNLVAIDLSNFRCGHDAPIYSVIESILEATHTPYFTFHDIDENKPATSIRLRIETIDYFLKQYHRHLERPGETEQQTKDQLSIFRTRVHTYTDELNLTANLGSGR